jgi:hypothetical protein
VTVIRGRTFTYDAYYLRVSPTRDRIGVRVESVNLVETIMLGLVNPLGDYLVIRWFNASVSCSLGEWWV